jgi:hypothetical protein
MHRHVISFDNCSSNVQTGLGLTLDFIGGNMPKTVTNEQRIKRMMNFSHFGALKQGFIMEAIRAYAEQQLAEPWSSTTFVNQDTWKSIAQECLDDLKVCP